MSYPDGARRTAVPDLFFGRDLPELGDPVALKLLLHVMWRVHRRGRGHPAALREAELLDDPVLRRGVTVLGYAPEAVDAALTAALGSLAKRGTLLSVRVAEAGGQVNWWAVADREGRSALTRLAAGGDAPAAAPKLGDAVARPNIYALFETNIGVLTPMVAEELREAEAAFAADWIEDAMRSAAANGVRKWSYVRAILDRWRRDGRDDTAGGREDRHEGHRRDAGRGGQARGGHSIVPHIEY